MIGAPTGAADGAVEMALILTLENLGGPPVSDELGLSVAYQGVETATIELAVPTDTAGLRHIFMVSMPPGDFRFEVLIGANSFPFDIVVPASNLVVGDATYEALAAGAIAIDVDISNIGNLVATNVLVVATMKTASREVSGASRVEAIRPGESVGVRVPLALPDGEHVVRITVTSDSIEVALDDNAEDVDFSVAYVQLDYDYAFAVGGYWSDGSANVSISVTVGNMGVGAFDDVAKVSYRCSGATANDDVRTGVFDISLPNGFGPVTNSVTLRSSPGTVGCRFATREGAVEEGFQIPAKVVGISREVWECYSDSQVNRHGDIGCAGRESATVVKWETEEPITVWATGSPKYIEVLWESLGELGPLLGMRFTRADEEEGAQLKAYVGITRDQGPVNLRSGRCADASGCASIRPGWSGIVRSAQIGVWTVDSDWYERVGLVDRWIKHVTLHELVHALVPMDHRDDPLSVVNNINGPVWDEIGEFEEALIRLHMHPLIKPGMTMDEVGEVVLTEGLLDHPPTATPERSDMGIVRDAYSALQQAGTARWSVDGGWDGARCDFKFGVAGLDIADLAPHWASVWRFNGGSDRLISLYGEEWSRESGRWARDPDDFWDDTNFRSGFTSVQRLLVSILYFSDDDDLSVTRRNGETMVRVFLERSTIKPDWARSVELRGRFTVNDRTGVITGYELDWYFDVIASDSCDHYKVRAWDGEYGVRFEIPDEIYNGTSAENRRRLDEDVLGD